LTRVEYSGDVTLFNLRGTHSLPVLLYDRNGTSFPTLMLVDTGASKCMIPASYSREYLKLPTLGKTEGVVTADGRVSFDNVSIPRITLAELVLKSGPEYAQLIPNETDLQEANVDA